MNKATTYICTWFSGFFGAIALIMFFTDCNAQQHYQDFPPNKVKDSLETLHGKLTIERNILMNKIDSLENDIQRLSYTIRQMNGEAKPRIAVKEYFTAVTIAEAIRKEGNATIILAVPGGWQVVTNEEWKPK